MEGITLFRVLRYLNHKLNICQGKNGATDKKLSKFWEIRLSVATGWI